MFPGTCPQGSWGLSPTASAPGWGAETPVAKSKSTFLSCGPHEMAEGGVIAKMCTFSSLLFIHFNRNCSNLRSETSLWTENPSQVSIHTLDLCLLFQDIDKFGNEITQLARPLPVECTAQAWDSAPPPFACVRARVSSRPPARGPCKPHRCLPRTRPCLYGRPDARLAWLESGGFPRACGRV